MNFVNRGTTDEQRKEFDKTHEENAKRTSEIFKKLLKARQEVEDRKEAVTTAQEDYDFAVRQREQKRTLSKEQRDVTVSDVDKGAEKRKNAAEDAVRKAQEAEKKKVEEQIAAKEKAIRNEEMKAKADEDVAKVQKEQKSKIQELNDKIGKMKDAASQWEQEAKRVRSMSFKDWNKEKNREERQNRIEGGKRERDRQRVKSRLQQLEKMRNRKGGEKQFERDGRLRKEWERLKEWDEKNNGENPAGKAIDQLENQKVQLMQQSNDDIKKILQQLKDAML